MNEAFGEWLRRQRKEKRLTLRAVAAKSKLGIGHLSLLENGKRKPKVESLAPLATAIGVPYGDLLRAAGYLDDRNLLFAHRLHNVRLDRQIEMRDLATACGLSQKTVERWESGSNQLPSQKTVERLAGYLQVTPDYLLGLTDRPESATFDLRSVLEMDTVTYNGTPLTVEQKTFVADLIRRVLDFSGSPSNPQENDESK